MSKHTAVPGLTFQGTFEPDGAGTYRLIGGATKADAILFAAAPDLLAACKVALSDITTDGGRIGIGRYGEKVWKQHVEQLLAAIAKAEGGDCAPYHPPCYCIGDGGAECGRANVRTTSKFSDVRCPECRSYGEGGAA